MVIPDKVDIDRQSTSETDTTDRLTSRSIRSFVVRNGRTTPAQADAIQRLMPRYGINYSNSSIDLNAAFGNAGPVWMEIGFGNGDVLLNMASTDSSINVLGAEVHTAGIGHALIGSQAQQLENIRIIQHDAMEVLENMLEPASLDKVLLLFPDPWHKKRHHKRRLFQQDFLDNVARVLKPGGILHCATDWAEYGHWMLKLLEKDTRFSNNAGTGNVSDRPAWRPITRFERRGHRLGHGVTDLLFTRC